MSYKIDNKTYLILFLISSVIFLASLYHREITYDDAFFAEQAYWANKIGYVRSELFNDYEDWGTRQYIYLKLHVWQTALVDRIFGWSAYIFKTIPLVYLCIFIFFAYQYYKRYLSPDGIEPFYFFLSLLLLNTYVVHFGFENRPEIMQMCVGFLSFLSLRQGIKFEKPLYIISAGLLAGITVLFHFNGIIYITAGAGLIIYMRYYRYLLYFVVAAACIAPIYWYEMIANHAVDIAINQMINYPSLSKEGLSLKNILLKILFSPKRYVIHLQEFSYVLLFILSLYFNRHSLKSNPEIKILLVYLIISELTLIIIAPGGKAMYLVLHLPYVLFIIAVLNKSLFHKPLHKPMLYAFTFYTLAQIGHIGSLISHHNSEIIDQHAQIVEKYHIQKSEKIIAPDVFVFNQVANTKITATELFSYFGISGKLVKTTKELFEYAHRHDYRYLILRKNNFYDIDANTLILGQVLFGYRLIGHDFEYYIFRKQP